MRTSPLRLAALALSSMTAFVLAAGAARAETVNCTAITVAPATISTAGLYCLTDDLTVNLASGNAITITANNVVLDLNGHRIANLAAGMGTGAFGIYAAQRQNITIRNGLVRGFFIGVSLDDVYPYTNSQGHVVEDVHALKNTFVGISVLGHANIVRHNYVESTGGTTLFGGSSSSYAIQVYGTQGVVVDNDVSIVTKVGDANAWGIYFGSPTDDGVAINNRVASADTGLEMATASVKFRDNLTVVVGTPFVGGTNAGNNN